MQFLPARQFLPDGLNRPRRFTPSADSTSAEPQELLTLLFPCFTTGMPAPAATSADAVLILKVHVPSPPVPQVSTRVFRTDGVTVTALRRITRANAAISSGVSPFMRSATRNAPIWDWAAVPSMMHPHHLLCIPGREVPPLNEVGDGFLQVHENTPCGFRKFLMIRSPSGERILSGWNWTPQMG